MSWCDDSICRPTTVCQKVPGSRKNRLRPPIISMSQMTRKMPTSGRQNFFRKAIILHSTTRFFSLQLGQLLEIQFLINIGQLQMSVGIAGNVVKINRMADGCQGRSTLQPTVAIAIGVEIDSLQVYDANGQDLPPIGG